MINVVCAVVQNELGEVLACQRPEGKSLAGKWEFPGGKIEPNETPRAALQREIIEELDCVVEVGKALAEVEHHYPDFSIHLMPFLCHVTSGIPMALEHAQLRWVSLTDCSSLTLDWAEADVPVWEGLIGKLA